MASVRQSYVRSHGAAFIYAEEVEDAMPQSLPRIDEPPPPDPAEALKIETPVIQIQDVAHNPTPETRVSNKGVKVVPKLDAGDERDLAREDEAAIEALEELERSIRRQAPS